MLYIKYINLNNQIDLIDEIDLVWIFYGISFNKKDIEYNYKIWKIAYTFIFVSYNKILLKLMYNSIYY